MKSKPEAIDKLLERLQNHVNKFLDKQFIKFLKSVKFKKKVDNECEQ